jgi:hypothetical protein
VNLAEHARRELNASGAEIAQIAVFLERGLVVAAARPEVICLPSAMRSRRVDLLMLTIPSSYGAALADTRRLARACEFTRHGPVDDE